MGFGTPTGSVSFHMGLVPPTGSVSFHMGVHMGFWYPLQDRFRFIWVWYPYRIGFVSYGFGTPTWIGFVGFGRGFWFIWIGIRFHIGVGTPT